MSTPASPRIPTSALTLDFPMSLGVYDRYEEAQRAVDYLSDHEFPVQHCLIVGTDLKQVERVTGRMTMAKAVGSGALSGMWMGLMVGLLMSMFATGGRDTTGTILWAVLAGAFFLAVWAGIGYALTQGKRDFTSVSQVVATRYEILVESATFTDADPNRYWTADNPMSSTKVAGSGTTMTVVKTRQGGNELQVAVKFAK